MALDRDKKSHLLYIIVFLLFKIIRRDYFSLVHFYKINIATDRFKHLSHGMETTVCSLFMGTHIVLELALPLLNGLNRTPHQADE